MKSRSNPFLRSASLAASIVLCFAESAKAGSLTWDGSDTVNSGAQGGIGTWDANTTLNWWNGTADVVWPNSGLDNDAIFGGTAGTVTIASGGVTVNDMLFNTTGYTLSGAGTITLNGTTPTITTASGVTTTIGNNTATVLAGTAGLTKTGAGTLILNGSAVNTFTGATTINQGTLTLDFANLGTPTDLLKNTSTLAMGGGTLSILGKNAGTTLQTVASTALNSGASIIALNRGTGSSTTLNLGALSGAAGSTISFQPTTAWAGGANATSAGTASTTEIVTVSSVSRPGGAITMPGAGSFAYIGANAFNGTGTATRYLVAKGAASGPYQLVGGPTSTGFVTSGGSATTVYSITASQNLGGALTNYGLLGNSTGAATIALANNAYTLNGYIGINTGTTTISTTGTGTLVVGTERDFVANIGGSGGLTISAPIVNNGGGASNVTLTSTGTGILTLSGANTYSGVTTINSGTLAIALAANETNGATSSVLGAIPASGTTGKLVFNGGTLSIAPSAAVTMASARGILVNAGGGTMKNTAAQTISTSAIIAGTGAMTFDTIASGAWTLGGANTFSGGATVTGAGTIFIAHNTAFGSGTLTLNGPQVRGSTAGTYTLANAVNIAANTTFASVAGENTLTFSGPVVLTGGNRTLTANIGTSVANKSTVFSGGISEDVAGRSLTKAGTGTLTLSGASTYTGTTTVSAGRLALTKNTALYNNNTGSWTAANVTVASGATLALNVGSSGTDFTSANISSLAGLGTASTGFVNGSYLGLDTTSGDFTYAGDLSNPNAGANALGVIKLGANSLTLSGDNNYSGNTLIGGGTLVAGSTSAFGSTGKSVFFMTTPAAGTSGGQLAGGNLELATDSSVNAYQLNGTSSFASTLILNRATAGAGITQNLGNWISGNNVLNVTKGANVTSGTATVSFTGMSMGAGSGGTATLTPTDTNISITGPVNSTTNNAKTLVLDGNIAGNSISGDITNGLNTLSLTKSGTSTWTLSGNNSYTGATAVNAGTLKAGSITGLSSSSAFTTADVATAILDLDGYSNTIGSLAGGGATGGNVALGTGTLTTGGNNTSTSYAGNISGTGGNLIKTGTGTFTLASANGYTGTTAVNGGTLLVNNSLASSGTTVANLATLGGTGTIANLVTVKSGGMLSAATSTTAGTLTLGALTLDAGSNLSYEFGGTSDLIAVTGASGLTLNGGALSLYTTGGVVPLTANGTYSLFSYSTGFGGSLANLSVLNSQAGKTYAVNDTGSLIQLVLGTATSSDWSGTNGDGLWTTDGVGNNWNDGSQPNALGAVANFGNLAGTPQTVTLNGGKTVGSILFDNSNAFTIGTTSDAITLDNGIAAGALGVTSGSHAINAPIILNGPANIAPAIGAVLALGGNISGSKALTLTGAGTTILSGTNSYTTTTVSAGKLQIGDGVAASGTLGSGAVSLASGTTLEFNRTGSYSAANNITGPAATLTLTNGAITLSGTKSLSVLNLAGGSPTISGTNTITTANLSGGTGTISGTNTITTLGVTGGDTDVSGSTITTANVSSSGVVNFSNSNTITTANVSGGTATFSGTNSLTTLNLSGGTAKGGSATGFGSTATLVMTGTGTLDLNGANASFIGNVPTGVSTNTITDSAAGTGTSTVTFGQTSTSNVNTAALITDGATRKVGVAFTNNNAGQTFSNADNTFSGGLTLLNMTNGTRLTISSAVTTTGSAGSITKSNFGTGAITIGQAATDKAGIYVTNATTVANEIVFNTALGTDTPGLRVDVTGFTLSGKITANLSDALFSSRAGTTSSVSLTGKVTGSQGLRLDNTYNNIFVTLNNTAETNDYQGATTISGTKGVLILGASNQIPNGASAGNVVNNGTLRLQGFSDTINGLSGSGTVTTTAAGASMLTLGDNDTTSSFSGTISNTTGTVGIIKIGSGDQTFSSTSSYTGGTSIKNGSLILSGGNDRLLTTGSVALGDVSTSGKLVLGDATTARNQTLGGLTSTGLGGNVVGANATTDSLLTLNIASGTNTFGGVLGGGGTNENKLALTKSGNGTLELTNTSTYTGATIVSGGKLVINGNISTSTLTTVNSGATLAGSGTVGKTVINGTLAVGNSPGTVNFTDTLGLNGTTVMEIDGMSGAGVTGGHDFINLTGVDAAGVLTYGGTLTLDIGAIFGIGSYSWNLFDMASQAGTFSTVALADQYSGSLLDTDVNGVWDLTSGDNTWQFTQATGVLGLTVVPEPNVAALLGGLGTLLLLRRRRSA